MNARTTLLTAGLLAIPSILGAFGVNPPTLRDIEIMAGFGAFVFLTMEGIKAYLRRTVWRQGAGT